MSLAVDADIRNGRRHVSVRIDCNMDRLVEQEVVSLTLTDDRESVDEGEFRCEAGVSVRLALADSSSPILGTTRDTDTADALRLEVILEVRPPIVICF